ncbi:MFS general substrate transporter [Leucogyrophana mollusca]|uniref:MFS general substrate transporter n=1 Tax=Leucogyrophana mollusca TaxID=85980 RepID=A0ACB8AXZ5_9AGAM|nr:MFS general substrate transporter [Leucogyrophana mollusca]
MSSPKVTRSPSRTSLPRPSLASSTASCPDSTVSSQDTARTIDSASFDFHDDTNKSPGLSTSRLLFAHIGAALTLFLATTDSTIVSTSLPTITSDLRASQSQYTWVGVAYMLTQTACQPLYGRLSDLIGRKNVLYTSMMIFALGSLLCGASKSIMCLILARGLAGLGGGGIVSSVWVITSEIVEERNRAKWSQSLSVTWSCSAVAGPLLGGLFSTGNSTTISWRWAFYLNLPVCLVAFIVIALSLRNVSVGHAPNASWKTFAQRFDFLGLLLFMTGTSCVVVGFSFAMSNGWGSPSTLTLVILGPVILACGGFYEVRTTRDALFPPAAFKNITAIIILVITFLHNLAFNAGTFYLALYFQAVNGSTPLLAGVQMLPYSLGSSLASMPAAWFIGWWQDKKGDTSGQKWVIAAGLMLASTGFGLMILLNQTSSHVLQAVFPLIAGIGLGMLFHAPYQVFTRALSPSELATGTSAFFLVRFTGATIGLAVAGMTFNGLLAHNLPSGYQIQGSASSINWKSLSSIQPLSLRWEVLGAISVAIKTIWIVCTPCLCLAMVLALLMKRLPIEERIDHTPSQEKTSSQKTPSIGSSQPEQV